MKNILYFEPRHKDKIYFYYNYLGNELIKLHNKNIINLTMNKKGNYNNYDLIILGYGACANANFLNIHFEHITTPIIAFLFKLSIYKDNKFKYFKKYNIILLSQHTRISENNY